MSEEDYKLGHLAHKAGGDLAYVKSGDGTGHLAYKSTAQLGEATITIEWFNSDRDLDILGFWVGDPDHKCGWNQGYSGPYTGRYESAWSGDDTSESGREVITLKMNPWNSQGWSHDYVVHFNFYGEGSSCTVWISQGGKTYKKDQPCSNRSGQAANTSDPSITITFGNDGRVSKIDGRSV